MPVHWIPGLATEKMEGKKEPCSTDYLSNRYPSRPERKSGLCPHPYRGCRVCLPVIFRPVARKQLTPIYESSDFIFGQHARAWFHDCDIRVLKGPSSGYITANGRSSETDSSYYVIHKSSVAAADGNDVPSGTYYLGTS